MIVGLVGVVGLDEGMLVEGLEVASDGILLGDAVIKVGAAVPIVAFMVGDVVGEIVIIADGAGVFATVGLRVPPIDDGATDILGALVGALLGAELVGFLVTSMVGEYVGEPETRAGVVGLNVHTLKSSVQLTPELQEGMARQALPVSFILGLSNKLISLNPE